ncbi:winged helix-turn-helix domain-containing protein [Cellulomonas pakistanensis]|uniref:Transcriptional regulator n=1 Tax=Cellulomonas pakistanensis TaxID=992287 RepID=A0A919P9F0_9CELL|nr:winged helix-turn-helix domain-containing protein [Cellulomonas pakistanensis]GIG35538.1 transcriptional regulator [Cellulomonas pakistanensis]
MTEPTDARADLDDLRDRVAALERRLGAPPAPAAGPRDGDDFWALSALRARLADHESTSDGAVVLVGSLRLPTGEPVSWQQGAGTAGLLEIDWSDRAPAFAALGSPVRIELLRHVLAGTRSTAELAALEQLGTTGQLHHHLRQLLAAGWLRQSGRGAYEVPAARVVPLLACLAAVER